MTQLIKVANAIKIKRAFFPAFGLAGGTLGAILGGMKGYNDEPQTERISNTILGAVTPGLLGLSAGTLIDLLRNPEFLKSLKAIKQK